VGWRDAIDDTLGAPAIVAAIVFGATVVPAMSWYNARKLELEAERNADVIPQLVAELKKNPPRKLDLPNAPRKGATDPEVVLVEFADFECPHCAKLFNGVEEYFASTDRRVQLVFAHYPLGKACNPDVDDRHKYACFAAAAAECASTQGKFWEYAAHLFANQGDLEPDDLREHAQTVGLDLSAYDKCIDDPATAARIKEDVALGGEIEITGTPTFFINGYRWSGAMPPSVLAGVVDGLLAEPAAAPTDPSK
jgi:protein-disulfide isomerase